jgi:hypothetical protein
METKGKVTGFKNSGRFGAIKNFGLSLRMAGFNTKTLSGIPESTYISSEDCHNHLIEMEYQKSRTRAEAQRFQYNR